MGGRAAMPQWAIRFPALLAGQSIFGNAYGVKARVVELAVSIAPD